MRYTRQLLLVALCVSPGAFSREIDLLHMRRVVAIDIQSYGEPATALIELLMPFLSTHHFAEDRPRSMPGEGKAMAVFSNIEPRDRASSDAVVANGKFNSVCVMYYSWVRQHAARTQKEEDDLNALNRASAFLGELKDYLYQLPTPRLEITGIVSESTQNCASTF
jgi:hypothetical protein